VIRSTFAAFVAATTISATQAPAATIADVYSSFWVFGDSLSDTGNISRIAAAPPVDFPPAPYYEAASRTVRSGTNDFLDDFRRRPLGQSSPSRDLPIDAGSGLMPDFDDQVDAFTACEDARRPGARLDVVRRERHVRHAIIAAVGRRPGQRGLGVRRGRHRGRRDRAISVLGRRRADSRRVSTNPSRSSTCPTSARRRASLPTSRRRPSGRRSPWRVTTPRSRDGRVPSAPRASTMVTVDILRAVRRAIADPPPSASTN
jgi:hypothetical protein